MRPADASRTSVLRYRGSIVAHTNAIPTAIPTAIATLANAATIEHTFDSRVCTPFASSPMWNATATLFRSIPNTRGRGAVH